MSWRRAQSLVTGCAELDALFPRRPKTGQEGFLGNADHVGKTWEDWVSSDHNPFVLLNGEGIVRAWDIDSTASAEQIAAGESFDPNVLAEYLAERQRERFGIFGTHGYVIWNRRITTSGSPGGVWQKYNGSDPHDRHIHVSVGITPWEYDSTAAWNLHDAFGKVSEEDELNVEENKALGETRAIVGNIQTVVGAFNTGGLLTMVQNIQAAVARQDAFRDAQMQAQANGGATDADIDKMAAALAAELAPKFPTEDGVAKRVLQLAIDKLAAPA